MAGSSDQVRSSSAATGGADPSSAAELLPLVYDELRNLAASRLAGEPGCAAGQTLQATALVHEAYLRLVANGTVHWNGRAHFFGAAALAMRRILVERARQRSDAKHGGRLQRVPLENVAGESGEPPLDLLALDEALTELERQDKRRSDVVMLQYFAGLSQEEAAEMLGVSPATVKRDWTYARAWLFDRLNLDLD